MADLRLEQLVRVEMWCAVDCNHIGVAGTAEPPSRLREMSALTDKNTGTAHAPAKERGQQKTDPVGLITK